MKKFFAIALVFSLVFVNFMGNVYAISLDTLINVSTNAVTTSRRAVSIGDVDGDGNLDAVGESTSLQFAVTRNIKGGTVSYEDQTHLTPVQFGIYTTDLADFDSDGDLDLVMGGANGSSSSPNFVYYWDDATNNRYEYLTSAYTIGNKGMYCVSLVTGDFVEDGKPDIIWFEYDAAYLATNTTSGTNASISFSGLGQTNLTIGNVPFGNQASAVGDFNGDDHLDFVIADDASGGGGFYNVGLGDGAGNFTVSDKANSADGYRAYAVEVADFNQDGKDDFLLARNHYGNTDAILYLYTRNVANDGFDETIVKSSTTTTYRYIETGNFDFDTYPDFGMLDNSSSMQIHVNQGDGTFNATPELTQSTSSTYQIWFEEMSGDSKVDVLRTAGSGYEIAYFPQNTLARTLTYTAGSGGTISGSTSQTIADGGNGTAVTAVPNTGYHFVDWSDASTDNPRTDTSVGSDISVTANFAINTYTLAYAATTGGSISGTKSQTVNYGAGGSAVTAVANTGYEFVGWSDGKTTNPRTDTNVTSNKSVTAIFSLIEVDNSDETPSGSGSTGGNSTDSVEDLGDTELVPEETEDSEPSSDNRFVARITRVGGRVYISQLKVRVLDSNGNPVSNLELTLSSDIQIRTTDADGYALFEYVEVGDHKLSFTHNGQDYTKGVEIDEPSNTADQVELEVLEVKLTDISNVVKTSGELDEGSSAWSVLFMCIGGILLIGGLVLLAIWYRKRSK